MRRRDFIAAGAGLALAGAARAGDGQKRVGILMSTAEDDPSERASIAAFTEALAARGWIEGKTVTFTILWGAGDPQRMAANAESMVAAAPNAILAKGATMPALKRITATIPVVFVIVGDTAAEQYVTSFARPGGNITGFATNELTMEGKRLQLLREMSPGMKRILYLTNPLLGTGWPQVQERLKVDARAAGVIFVDGTVRSPAEIDMVIDSFAREPNGGMLVGFNAFTTVNRAQIMALAARHRLPAIYPMRQFADEGGLFSYGANQEAQFGEAAFYMDRILNGEKPGDLPVQEPARFEMVVNVGTAQALGLTVPTVLLATADAVIE